MQGRVITLGGLLIACGCALPQGNEDSAMQKAKIEGMQIEMKAPETIPDPKIRPGSPLHDAGAAAVTVTFKNESGRTLSAPLDEIGNGLVLIYTVEGAPEPLVDNAIPPPPMDGSVMTLGPGASHVVRLGFGYPESLMPAHIVEPVVVRFCVRWSKEWLRAKNYAEGKVQWNESFEVCSDVQITRD